MAGRGDGLSCPGWLLERWATHFGPDAGASNRRSGPATSRESYIRVPSRSSRLRKTSNWSQPRRRAVSGCSRRRLPGMRLHDIGSQAIIPLLDLAAGAYAISICAPLRATRRCKRWKRRLGWRSPAMSASKTDCRRCRRSARAWCWMRHEPLPFRCTFDRIFVDAPCSGTGTLGTEPGNQVARPKPKTSSDFRGSRSDRGEQRCQLLAAGGKLLYATCSLEREENEEVIAAVLERQPGFRVRARGLAAARARRRRRILCGALAACKLTSIVIRFKGFPASCEGFSLAVTDARLPTRGYEAKSGSGLDDRSHSVAVQPATEAVSTE